MSYDDSEETAKGHTLVTTITPAIAHPSIIRNPNGGVQFYVPTED
jgi:hypothetical protein